MREFARRYARGTVDVLKHLNDRVRLLGAHAPAWLGRSWSNRDQLFRQGVKWIGRHKGALLAALFAFVVLWAIGRIGCPAKVLSWEFWTAKPEDVRSLLLVSLGAVAAAIGLVLAAIRTHAAYLQARVAAQGHITDRFIKAIEQLGHDKLEVRLGAIYALERIAWDSRRDHGPIVETLTAYIRENAPWPPKGDTEALEELVAAHVPVGGGSSGEPAAEGDQSRAKPRTDIQAILTVLGRRDRRHDVEEERLNLRGTCLRGADLIGAHLERAILMDAHLEGANPMGVRGLTQEQLVETYWNKKTRLPKSLATPLADAAER